MNHLSILRQLDTLKAGFKARFGVDLTESMIAEIVRLRIEEDKKTHLKSMLRDMKTQDLRELLTVVESGRETS